MTQLRKLLALLLCLMMALSFFPAAALAEGEDENAPEEPAEDGAPVFPEEDSSTPPEDLAPDDTGDASEALPPEGDDLQRTVASGQCGDDLTWTLSSDGVLTVSGSGDMWNWGGQEDCLAMTCFGLCLHIEGRSAFALRPSDCGQSRIVSS